MKLTIIIPHFNSSESLEKLINSIPEEKKIEIIVIDDKSNQNEIEKIRNSNYYSRIIFLENTKEKKGAGICRNIGLENSTGSWILFADSDDFFLKNFYEKVEKYFNQNFDIVFFKTKSIFMDTNLPANRNIEFNKLINDCLKQKTNESIKNIKYKFVVPWSKLIKKELIDEYDLKFDEIIAANDVMFSVKLGYHAKNIDISNQSIYCVTVSKGSLTKRRNIDIFKSRFSVHKRRNQFLKEKGENKFLRPGISYLVLSLRYGAKIFFEVLLYIIKNLSYIFYSYKNWKEVIYSYYKNKNEKSYYTK